VNRKLQCSALIIVITLNLILTSLIVSPSFAGNVSAPASNSSTNQNSVNGLVGREAEKSNSVLPDDSSAKWDFTNPNEWIKLAYGDGNTTRLIVGLDENTGEDLSRLKELTAEYSARIVDTVSVRGEPIAAVVELTLMSVSRFVEQTRSIGLADYVEPDLKIQVDSTPNDPYWNLQWGPQKIEADWAWNSTTGNSSVLVAVIDTGIDYYHPDLAANYVPLGYNWAYNNPDPKDDYGHGTHCAGIIAATINNNIGIAGLAQVKIMSEKVLDSSGNGYVDWFANGVINATDAGAKILSISLGGYGDSQLMHEALQYAYDAGVLIIAAAGNNDSNVKPYPAGYGEVVAVSATDQNDQKAGFSNWGDWIELAAPGVDVYSTVPTYHVTINDYGYPMNYAYMSGTSMACPHVAGVVALIWSRYPSKSRDWVRLWLRYTADDLGDPGFDAYYGYGRVNARKAVEPSSVEHDLIVTSFATPPYVRPGTQAIMNTTILNFGAVDETDVVAQFWANSSLISSQTIYHLRAGDQMNVSFVWAPTLEGLYNITVYAVPVTGETSVGDNAVSKNVFVGNPTKAVVLHSEGNVYGPIIVNWQELNNEWYLFGDSMVSIDYASLNKDDITYADLVASEADVLIISCASSKALGWEFTDLEIAAITRYVREGHGLIVTAGTLYYDVPNNNKLGLLLGINNTIAWRATYTNLLELVNTTHPIFTNIPNPVVFPQVGTSVSPDGFWGSDELADGNYLALGHFKESAIVEHNGLLYISPLLEAVPPYYKFHLQVLYNAIVWSRYQKPQHDLVASLETPTRIQPNETATLNASVENIGVSNETDVAMDLLIDDNIVASMTIPQLPNGSTYVLNYTWQPTIEKRYNVTVYLHPVPFEESTINNIVTRIVSVRTVKYVLFDQAHNNNPVSQYSTWIQSLESRNYVIDFLFSAPINESLLSKYDAFVTINPMDYYDFSEASAIQDFIEGGGGLLVVGEHALDVTNSLTNFAGITWSIGGMSGTTADITPHPVTEGVAQIYVDSPMAALSVSGSAQDLIRDVGHYITLAVSQQIYGKLVCFVDDDSLMDGVIEQAGNLLLAGNMLDWLSIMNRPEHDLSVTLEAPRFLELNSLTTLNVTVFNRGVENETDVMLQLFINDIAVDSETFPEIANGQKLAFNFAWTPSAKGLYNVTAYALPVAGENRTVNNVKTMWASVFFYANSSVSNEWVEAGSAMNWHGDDQSWQLVLPFSFPFYGVPFRSIYISSNGLITFDGPDSSFSNGISELARKLAIAPAWDDWVTSDPLNDIFIWENATHIGIRWFVDHWGNSLVFANFEVVLDAEGLIQFSYGSSGRIGISTTVGISNGAGHVTAEDLDSLDNIATRIFVPYNRDIAVYSVESSPTQVYMGQHVNVNVTVGNKGEQPEDFQVQALYENLTMNSNVPACTFGPLALADEPHQGNSIWIEPSYTSLANFSFGQRFNITVWINTTVPSYAWQVCVVYNSTRLAAERCAYTAGSTSEFFSGHVTNPVSPFFSSLNSTHSYVMFGEALIGDDVKQAGSASLCWIEFQVLQYPNVQFTDYLHFDTSDTEVLDPNIIEIPINLYDGTYGVGQLPTPPMPPPPMNLIGEETVHLDPGTNVTLGFTWDTLGLSLGEYYVKAVAVPLLGELDLNNNELTGGTIEILWRHDVAVINVTASRLWIYEGQNLTVDVTIADKGDAIENVTVRIYFNISTSEIVGKGTIGNLSQGENRTVTIMLNLANVTGCNNNTLTTMAMIAGPEYNPSDNTLTGPTITMRFLGDINGDGKVDITDVAFAAKAFGSKAGGRRWNPDADLNFDGRIDIIDVARCAKNFGKKT
jgi:thermitase